MSIGAIAVPIAANKLYLRALKALAYQNGSTMAELVRNAVDQTYGDQLKGHLEFFAAQSEDKNPQLGSDDPAKESTRVG